MIDEKRRTTNKQSFQNVTLQTQNKQQKYD